MSEMHDPFASPADDTSGDGDPNPQVTTTSTETPAAFKVISSQEEFEAALGKRLERERRKFEGYDEYKEKAEKFDAYEATQGTELEKLQRKVEKAEQAKAALEAKIAKAERLDTVREIADELGLPKSLIKRVQGDTEEDIRADIADLMEGLPASKKADDPAPKDKPAGPPSNQPKAKMTFTATGDESDSGLELSADDILKQIPRGGATS